MGAHPHRGFETVTIVYKGGMAHRDSTGESGLIEPGDVQWMTAGSGVLHEEFHTETFAKTGGTYQVVQLWVNLPAKHKTTAPSYQDIRGENIPVVALPNDAGDVRIIAGDYAGKTSPARTFSPMQVWDVRLRAGARVALPAASGWNTAVAVLQGNVRVNGSAARDANLVLLDQGGEGLFIEAESDALLLLLSGQPLNEPIVGRGPFVMNTEAQIVEAIADLNSGKFGEIAH